MKINLTKFNQRPLFGAHKMLHRLPELNGYMQICKDVIFPKILDTDYEDLYKAGGRPPISPRILMCVTILQFLERLPDRSAASNLIYRLDWKIAMGLEVDDPGFSHQLLSVWRGRLIENDIAKRIFDQLIEELKERGLVKKNGKQRIDSTHVLADLKELSRVELMTETLRLACKDLLLLGLKLPSWVTNIISSYEDTIKLYQISQEERLRILTKAGSDMLNLTTFIKDHISREILTKNLKTLISVFEQNFVIDDDSNQPELIKVATGKDHICSPHDPEARFGSKHHNIGYKAQIVETAERDQTNFIVDVESEDNEETDQGKVAEALKRLETQDLVPETLYADAGYISGKAIADANEQGVNVLGPLADNREFVGENLSYNQETDEYTCMAGKKNMSCHEETNGSKIYRFSISDCKNCPFLNACRPRRKNNTKNQEGRIVRHNRYHEEIADRRKLMRTDAFKENMKNRNAIEGTISALKRGAGFARCRYKGKKKFRIQLIFSAIAFNIKRLNVAFA